ATVYLLGLSFPILCPSARRRSQLGGAISLCERRQTFGVNIRAFPTGFQYSRAVSEAGLRKISPRRRPPLEPRVLRRPRKFGCGLLGSATRGGFPGLLLSNFR